MFVFIIAASLGFGGSVFFLVRALGQLLRQTWRQALLSLGLFLGLVVGGTGVFLLSLTFVIKNEAPDPSASARQLAEMIAEVMNCSAWVAAVCLAAGIVDAVWLHKRRSAVNTDIAMS